MNCENGPPVISWHGCSSFCKTFCLDTLIPAFNTHSSFQLFPHHWGLRCKIDLRPLKNKKHDMLLCKNAPFHILKEGMFMSPRSLSFSRGVTDLVPQNKAASNATSARQRFLPHLSSGTRAPRPRTRPPFSGSAPPVSRLASPLSSGRIGFHITASRPPACHAEWRGGDQSGPSAELGQAWLVCSSSARLRLPGRHGAEEGPREVQEATNRD